MTLELVPAGQDAQNLAPGDLIFCHRTGLASQTIRVLEHLRQGDCRWSHVAVAENSVTLIEALTRGVTRNPLSEYRDIEYAVVRMHLSAQDQEQAVAFLRSCLGEHYAWMLIAGIAVRYLTPGRGGFTLGSLDGTQICSGLAAQAAVRGPMIFAHEPSSLTPAELAASFEHC